MVVAVAAAVLAGGCGEPDPIRIGFVGTFSGRAPDLAVGGRDGALLLIEQINAQGGIDGRALELVVDDDRNDPAEVVAANRRLIEQGVVAIIGHMTSQMSVAAAPVVNAAHVVMVSPTTSTNELTGIDDYFFRVYAANAVEAEALGAVAGGRLGSHRVATALDVTNRSHSMTWRDSFARGLARAGGSIVLSREFETSNAARLTGVAGDILGQAPDGVAILAGSLDTGLLCQYLRAGGYTGPVFTSQWSITPDIFLHGGGAVDGIVFNNLYDRDDTSARHKAFVEAFGARFRYAPGFAAAFGYESAGVIAAALRRTRDRDEIKQAILAIGRFQGVQSEFEVDAFGDAARKSYLKTIRGGRIVDFD